MVYLWFSLLNNQKTKVYYKLLNKVFEDIKYSNEEKNFLEDGIDEIWDTWKDNFKVDNKIIEKVLKWLEKVVENRVAAIMEGNYRKSYYKAALLVVGYGEILESQELENKEEYINYYIAKYPRRSAFRAELKELM